MVGTHVAQILFVANYFDRGNRRVRKRDEQWRGNPEGRVRTWLRYPVSQLTPRINSSDGSNRRGKKRCRGKKEPLKRVHRYLDIQISMSQSIPVVTSSGWRKNGERKEMNSEKEVPKMVCKLPRYPSHSQFCLTNWQPNRKRKKEMTGGKEIWRVCMPFNIYTSVNSLIIGSDWPNRMGKWDERWKKNPQRVRYLYFHDKFFQSALQKGKGKRGAVCH